MLALFKQPLSLHAANGVAQRQLPHLLATFRSSCRQLDIPTEPKPKAKASPSPSSEDNDPKNYTAPDHPLRDRLPSFRDQVEAAERVKTLECLSSYQPGLFTPSLYAFWRAQWDYVFKLVFFGTGLSDKVRRVTIDLVTSEVESDFNEEEFLEGAKQAYVAVVESYAANDFDSLKHMVSLRGIEALQAANAQLQRQGVQVESVEAEVKDAYLNGFNLWSQTTVAEFDKSWSETVSESTSNSWLMLSVAFSSLLRVRLKIADGAAQEFQFSRSAVWLFVRGPLPRGRVTQLSAPWYVAGWW